MCCLLLAGCFSASPAARRYYYALQPPSGSAAYQPQSRYDVAILVSPFAADTAYRRQELVYRANPFEFGYYNNRRWAARPDKMLTDLYVDSLRRSQLVALVQSQITDRVPDYELRGTVRAVEELDSADDVWFARLALHVQLLRFSDHTVVWEGAFDETQPVTEPDPVFVVRALSRLFATTMALTVRELEQRFASLGLPASPALWVAAEPAPAGEDQAMPTPRARRIR
jgi:ABC-type uncharacterized transport system auxiliary subunit